MLWRKSRVEIDVWPGIWGSCSLQLMKNPDSTAIVWDVALFGRPPSPRNVREA
jgi:hypothetical protein